MKTKIFREMGAISDKALYLGSALHFSIETYLNSCVKEEKPVSEIFKSTTNQSFFKELSLGIIGTGHIFGEIDANFSRC